MIQLLKPLIALTLIAFVNPSYAVKVLECKDEQGNITYQDRCPPGSTPVGEKKYNTGNEESSKPESAKSDISATLYVMPECDTCDEVREFLTMREVSFTEKNIVDNVEAQTELKGITGGELRVPVTIIGESTIIGYSRQKLTAAVEGTGETSPQSEKPALKEKTEQKENEAPPVQ